MRLRFRDFIISLYILLHSYRDLRAKKHRDENGLFAQDKPVDWSFHFFFTSAKRHIDALIGYIIIFTGEQNHVARFPASDK